MDITLETNTFLENFWKWRLQNCPEFATFCGIHDYDSQLESFSIKAVEGAQAVCQQFLSEAEQLLSFPNVDDETESKLHNIIDELKTYLDGSKAKGYYFPITYFEGVQTEFDRLIAAMPLNTVEDFKNVISRYEKLPVQLDEMIEIMRLGISQNMTMHKISVEPIPEQIALFEPVPFGEQTKEDCVFYKPFASLPDTFSNETKEDILSKAVDSIYKLLGGFKKLKVFFETEYFNHTRPELGVSTLPDGKAFYQSCLDFHLSCSMTPEQVHQMGLKEVERISGEMTKVIKSLNLEMTIKEFSEKIRSDESFFFKDPEELLSYYKYLVFEKIYPLLPKVVKTIPKSKLEIRPNQSSTGGGAAAMYLAGSQDGKVPGVFYANVTDCEKSSPKYNMVSLALHEALPGHHLQLSHIMEDKTLPTYRRFVEDRKYSPVPSRFPENTAYIEGWGLYCEYLGYELGLYEDPYDHFGRLSVEMLRAARLVVDTGIHAFGWSFDKAVNYMLDNTAETKGHIEKEVRRYVTLPGQACAYKVGELKLKSLREEVEKALGSRFDVTEFHDMVLHNCGPLHTLEKKTKEFIAANA